jgi:hypothetical protein
MSKKTQIAKLILSMTHAELNEMAADITEIASNAADEGADYSLDRKTDVYVILRHWAKGLGEA